MGTEDQGWVAHFIRSALSDAPISVFGDGHQVRDVLHAEDAVAAYIAGWDAIGQDRRLRLQPRRRPGQRDQSGSTLDLSGDGDRPGARRPPFTIGGRAIRNTMCPTAGASMRRLRLEPPRSWRQGVARSRQLVSASGKRPRRRRERRLLPSRRSDARRSRQPELDFRQQHLFRVSRAAPSARAGLRQSLARTCRPRRPPAGWTSI